MVTPEQIQALTAEVQQMSVTIAQQQQQLTAQQPRPEAPPVRARKASVDAELEALDDVGDSIFGSTEVETWLVSILFRHPQDLSY